MTFKNVDNVILGSAFFYFFFLNTLKNPSLVNVDPQKAVFSELTFLLDCHP